MRANNALAPRDKSRTETADANRAAAIRQTRRVSADQATAHPAAKTVTAVTAVRIVPTDLS